MDKTYSHRTLVEKLGIKTGQRVLFIKWPQGYQSLLEDLPKNLDNTVYEDTMSVNGGFDFIQLFTQSQELLNELLPILKDHLRKTGMLWICFPKGHCNIRSNVNENIIREIGLSSGLIDTKIVSIDENWSGLKFVYQLKDRNN